MSTDSCVFCKIVALTEPAILVHESETTLAFLDARPVSRGHTLVVPPKRHAENLDALESHEGAEMFRVARSSPELYAAATSPLTESTFSSTTGVPRAKPCSTRTCTSSPRHRGDKAKFAAGLLARRAVELEQVGASIRSQLTV